ncbi:hypothetical protein PHYSODRAFT_508467 [Phytophthora sojae]|uniref:RNase H type-1 domain-containing protein n=1 Tax=Phytophthora sojae (strain P6497) TaxID=1094619 RepID=G4ZPU9_PHYSP|nr:hypothetical protein PHYSODRAFT_508467 [Phytophthora sojae]EGZ16354.1 hypothetical protein PHYSODRAFT_508467 [Phytophthora sojae]|eukprot:XP_009530103.1 hypothetical protein PHYSODRAFT_508467 [Phytophthora sojae]
MVNMLSDLAVKSRMHLADFIRLVRGQTADDPRPNKDLYELPRPPAPHLRTTWSRWNDVVRHGVVPEWLPQRPTLKSQRPPNHGSLSDHLPNVWRHIRKGQKEGRYLVVRASLAEQWKEVFISPLGVVAKAGTSPPDIRLINDYSFPQGESVNDFTDRTHLPEISYNPPGDITRRIFSLRQDPPFARILMMLGDVAGAFRHVPVLCLSVILPSWRSLNRRCKSRTSSMSGLLESSVQWTPVGVQAKQALFREASNTGTREGEGRRLESVLHVRFAKTFALNLLWCLRHISTCCPPARAFYQRLQGVGVALGRAGRRKLPTQAVEDLKWFRLILHHSSRCNRVRVKQFARLDEPTVNVFMDASNQGLCVLEPALKQFIRVQFTQADQELFLADQSANSINVRELHSAVLAALLWGPTWGRSSAHRPTQVRFWIDNTSAVSWTQRRASRQPLAQLNNRLLSLAEFNYSLVCTAAHIPGADNIMADAGSRAWPRADQHFDTWTNLPSGWTQVPVVAPYDDLSRLWEWCCANMPSLALPLPNIKDTGSSGCNSHDS